MKINKIWYDEIAEMRMICKYVRRAFLDGSSGKAVRLQRCARRLTEMTRRVTVGNLCSNCSQTMKHTVFV